MAKHGTIGERKRRERDKGGLYRNIHEIKGEMIMIMDSDKNQEGAGIAQYSATAQDGGNDCIHLRRGMNCPVLQYISCE